MKCGICSSQDIFSGSNIADKCRSCGAVEGPENWYFENEATHQAAWANEIVYMCENHMKQLSNIGIAMGCPITPAPCDEGHVCKNCENEEKGKEK